MSNQKLIRVKNGDQSTSLFTTDFNPPVLIPTQSSVALQNISLKLIPNVANISEGNNKFSYATVKPSTALFYNTLIEKHTATIPNGKYSFDELVNTMTILANQKLFWQSSAIYTKEQGAEILFNIDKDSQKLHCHFACRSKEEYCGPSPANITSGGYTYSIDGDNEGTITRTQPTVTIFDTYLNTTNIFCRGSGEVSIQDNSVYNISGSFDFDEFTTDADYSIADFPYGVGDTVIFEESGEKTITAIAEVADKVVITLDSDGEDDDVLYNNRKTIGYVLGLIETNNLKKVDPTDVLNSVTYGLMVLNDTNTYDPIYEPSVYYVKTGSEQPWINTEIRAKSGVITITLGRTTIYDEYKLRFFVIDEDDEVTLIHECDYTYGNYNMMMGLMTTTAFIQQISWTESKVSKSTTVSTGYYSTCSPDFLISDNKFVDVANLKKVEENVGFFGNVHGYITLNFFNQDTATLLGYAEVENISSDISLSSSLTVIIEASDNSDLIYGFPDSFILKVDLPLESYDQGREGHILSFIPSIVYNNASAMVYSPSPPIYINLKNSSPMYLDHLTVRLENENGSLLNSQETCSVVMLINSK
jgi:hypothetical protein